MSIDNPALIPMGAIESLRVALSVAHAVSGGVSDRLVPASVLQQPVSQPSHVYVMTAEELPDWSSLDPSCPDGWRNVALELGSAPDDLRVCWDGTLRVMSIRPAVSSDSASNHTDPLNVVMRIPVADYCRVNPDPTTCKTETTRDIALGSGAWDIPAAKDAPIDRGVIVGGEAQIKDSNGDGVLMVRLSQDGDPSTINIQYKKEGIQPTPIPESTPDSRLVGEAGSVYSFDALPSLTATPHGSDVDTRIRRETGKNFGRLLKDWLLLNTTSLALAEFFTGLGTAAVAFYNAPEKLLARYPGAVAERVRKVFTGRRVQATLSAGMTGVALLEVGHVMALQSVGLAVTPLEMAATFSLGAIVLGSTAIQFHLSALRNLEFKGSPRFARMVDKLTNTVEVVTLTGLLANLYVGISHALVDPRQAAVGVLLGGLWLSKWLVRRHPIKV